MTGADVVGLSDTAGALRSRFHAPAGVFELVILARSGAPVFTASTPVSAGRLEPALAAAMPAGGR